MAKSTTSGRHEQQKNILSPVAKIRETLHHIHPKPSSNYSSRLMPWRLPR